MFEFDPTNDDAFRCTFGVEDNLACRAALLNAVRRRVGMPAAEGLVLLDPLVPGDAAGEKPGTLDILVHENGGTRSDIEMQVVAHRAFPPRVLCYWAAKYRDQLPEGTEYHSPRPVHCVLLLGWVMYPDLPAAVHRCRPCDPKTGAAFGDQLEIIVVEPPKYISADPVERAQYEARWKQRRDIASLIYEGREDGWIDGQRRGELLGAARTLLKVLGRPPLPAEAWATMTEAELTALVAELEQAIAGGRP